MEMSQLRVNTTDVIRCLSCCGKSSHEAIMKMADTLEQGIKDRLVGNDYSIRVSDLWDIQRGIADVLNEDDYMASCGDVSCLPSPWIVSEWGRLDRKCDMKDAPPTAKPIQEQPEAVNTIKPDLSSIEPIDF